MGPKQIVKVIGDSRRDGIQFPRSHVLVMLHMGGASTKHPHQPVLCAQSKQVFFTL